MFRFLFVTSFIIYSSSLSAQRVDSARWSGGVETYYYFLQDEPNSVTLIGYADHIKWHFEGRYNYEDKNTASFFAGRKFNFGKKLQIEIVPMLGMIVGNTDGIAPGYELSVSWRKLDFYSETEYVFSFSGNADNFVYTWGELGLTLFDRLRTGFAYQHTRLYETDVEIQHGWFAEVYIRRCTVGVFYFNPLATDNVFILKFGIDF